MSSTGRTCLILYLLAAMAVGLSSGSARAGEFALAAPEQVEADWLRQDMVRDPPKSGSFLTNAKPHEDAAGACDGIKNGKWGFHTNYEDNPWWQVDLQKPTPLARLLIYNRCDRPSRATRLVVLLSDDNKSFTQAYQHDGSLFYGYTDKKPLAVDLKGAAARYVRIQLPGKTYLHFDEVEVYAVGAQTNVALNKPSTQSSVSQWSVTHKPEPPPTQRYDTAAVVERGLQLARRLKALGVAVDGDVAALNDIGKRVAALKPDAPETQKRALLFEARRVIRKMSLSNPLLDFDTLLFVKSAPGYLPHMSDQFYGWFSRPGGGIYLLEGLKSGSPRLRCLTADLPEGSYFPRPDLSYDATKLLFCYCRHYPDVLKAVKVDKEKLPEDCFYHIYEMNIDGTGRRQITRGRYDDFDPKYLPSGEIVFLSTRKGTAIQAGKHSAEATARATLPDSFVRCGGGKTRPVAVFTLHVMDANGGALRAISAFENFEWTPFVGNDGRVMYARWDYIDRPNASYISLWATTPDGTNPELVYGNFTVRPQCVFEAQPIPNSPKLIFTASAHHSITGGSLVLLDRRLGTEQMRPITRLTPDVKFPETEGWPTSYYASPFPLSEEFFLVSWSDRPLPPHSIANDERNPVNACGIYLCDAFGNLELIYRDPNISSMYPIPVRPRTRPPVIPSSVVWDGPQEGRFALQDVYQGLPNVPRGTIKTLRIVGVLPKLQPEMNTPNLGVSREDPGKFLLGSAPVEPDGSAYFRVPSGLPVFFQAIDGNGIAVQTMRTLTYVQPGQTLSCIGCHESREFAPLAGKRPLALQREPSRLTPGPPGAWPLRFDQLVQPLLDKHCVSCHNPGSDNEKGRALDLTAAKAYESLIGFGGEDLKKLAFERGKSVPGEGPAAKSKLYAILKHDKGHEGVILPADDLYRLVVWMDLYAHRIGSFTDAQEQELLKLRETWAGLLLALKP